MKYPFTPDILDALPEELASLFRTLEDTLLNEICSRLKAADELNEVTVDAIRALRAHGIPMNEINKAIQNTAAVGEKRLKELFDDVVKRNQAYYTELIDIVGVTAPEALVDESDIEALRKQTLGEFQNITQSMGFMERKNGKVVGIQDAAKAYQSVLDNAELEILSGAKAYNASIRQSVKNLADSGIRFVRYDSDGKVHFDHADVAVRRAVMTGINQTCQKYAEQSVDYLKTDLVEVSAHRGARDTGYGPANHKSWQGKIYHWREKSNKPSHYPDFVKTTGYGSGEGLGGWNCRHHFYAFCEGVMDRTYTEDELRDIDIPPFEYQGRTYTQYEASQKQREIERSVRKLKREHEAFNSAGLSEDATATKAKMRRLNAQYKAFSKTSGLPMQTDRMKVAY